jgi:hypothetical protein
MIGKLEHIIKEKIWTELTLNADTLGFKYVEIFEGYMRGIGYQFGFDGTRYRVLKNETGNVNVFRLFNRSWLPVGFLHNSPLLDALRGAVAAFEDPSMEVESENTIRKGA